MFDKKAEEAKRLLGSVCYQWNELAIFLTLNVNLLGSSWSDICKKKLLWSMLNEIWLLVVVNNMHFKVAEHSFGSFWV